MQPHSRSEIVELAQIFRARVVDVGGCPHPRVVGSGQNGRHCAGVAKFGLREVARTGKSPSPTSQV